VASGVFMLGECPIPVDIVVGGDGLEVLKASKSTYEQLVSWMQLCVAPQPPAAVDHCAIVI